MYKPLLAVLYWLFGFWSLLLVFLAALNAYDDFFVHRSVEN